MSDLTQHLPKESKTVKAIFDHYKKVGDAEPARGYLGASIIGHECERYLWYNFRDCCKESIEGRIYRLFETGDLEEVRLVKNLRDIGCEVHEEQQPPTGGWPDRKTFEMRQFAVSAFGGHFSGHLDGCVLGLPEAPKTWHVCEFKTHKQKSFTQLLKEGVEASKPTHYAQMQIYMHLTGMKRAIYLAVNKDTDELYAERVNYDKTKALALMAKAERIIFSTILPARIADRPDFYRCRWCSAKDICWGTGKVALPVPSLSCRQCCHATPDPKSVNGGWGCRRGGKALNSQPHCSLGKDDNRICEEHLTLPMLLSFAEPTDYRKDKEGDDFIEFTNTDGAKWKHGNREGCYSSEELRTLPATALTNEMMQGAKEVFGDLTAEGCEMDLLHRYPENDSTIIWKGKQDDLVDAWKTAYDENLLALTPVTRDNTTLHSVVELEGERVAIIWRINGTAEIREGKK